MVNGRAHSGQRLSLRPLRLYPQPMQGKSCHTSLPGVSGRRGFASGGLAFWVLEPTAICSQGHLSRIHYNDTIPRFAR